MSSKHSPTVLASGLVMGADLVAKFHSALVAAGGGETLLHFLTTKRGEETLKAAAEAAVKHRLPVPRSEVERIAKEKAASGKYPVEPEHLEDFIRFFWRDADLERMFGIPVKTFCNDPQSELVGFKGSYVFPLEIIEQIAGKPLEYPLVVLYEGEKWVVTYLGLSSHDPEPGLILQREDIRGNFEIALAKYFDLHA